MTKTPSIFLLSLSLTLLSSSAWAEDPVSILKDSSKDSVKRAQAALDLGKRDFDDSSIDDLLIAHLQDSESRVRVCSGYGLGLRARKKPKIAKRVIDLLESDNDAIKLGAARALAQFRPKKGSPAALKPLVKILRHPDTPKKSALFNFTVSAITKIPSEHSKVIVPDLIRFFKAGQDQLKLNISSAFGDIGPAADSAVPLIREMLKSKNKSLRGNAAATIGRLGPKSRAALPELLPLLDDKEPSVRGNAAASLAEVAEGSEEAYGVMIKHLKDYDSNVQGLLENSLRLIAKTDSKVVDLLIGGLTNPNARIASSAAKTLGDIGSGAKKAIPALEVMAKHRKKRLQKAAKQALKDIRS